MRKHFFKKIAASCSALAMLLTAFQGALKPVQAEEKLSIKIDLSKAIVQDENIAFLYSGYTVKATALFDQQELMPMTPDMTVPLISAFTGRNWTPNQKAEYGKISCYVDLGANYVITDIGLVDKNGSPDITFETGTPFAWTSPLTVSLSKYNAYRVFSYPSAAPTRYVHITGSLTDSGIGELSFYGYKVSELTEKQKAQTGPEPVVPVSNQTNLTAGQRIGCNVFIDDPLNVISACRNVREYHNLSWLIKEDGTTRFTFGTWADCDSFYSTMKNSGISLIPCLQGTCDFIRGRKAVSGETMNNLPVPDGADTLDPKSYAIHAGAMYNFAARYGSNAAIDPSTLNVSSDQTVKTGLNLVNALENSNEQNKTWEGKKSYFTPYEYAAMCSADYDGHEGTIPNAGVKTADKSFKLAMGGLVGGEHIIEYLTLMKTWFDYNRTDGKFAVDIINIHVSPVAACPEDSAYSARIQRVQDWIDQNAPGVELWISEFEIDAPDTAVKDVDNHNNPAHEQARADRIMRTYLLSLAKGADRITMFQLRDEWSGVYANSGLVTGKGEWNKKLAWYYTFCLSEVLKNADFVEAVQSSSLYILKFADRTTKEVTYCLWSPTIDGTVLPDYYLAIPEKFSQATLIRPEYDQAEGIHEALTKINGGVTLTVTETPVFVKLTSSAGGETEEVQKLILPRAISLGSLCEDKFDKTEICPLTEEPKDRLLKEFSHLFDETECMPATPFSSLKELPLPETTIGSVTYKYPMDCILYFDEPCTFTFAGYYDTFGTGKFDIYDDVTGELVFSTGLTMYKQTVISGFPEKVKTDRLRIVRYNDAKINSLMLFGFSPTKEKVQELILPDEIKLGALCESKFNHSEICDFTKTPNDRLLSEFSHLFDERECMPATPFDIISELPVPTTTIGSVTWKYPMDCILSFDSEKTFTNVGYYDSFGVGKFEIYDDVTGNLLFTTNLSYYKQTVLTELPEAVTTNRLRIVRYNDAKINSLMLFGYK